MKIAAVTEDGVTISQHFGRVPYCHPVFLHATTPPC